MKVWLVDSDAATIVYMAPLEICRPLHLVASGLLGVIGTT